MNRLDKDMERVCQLLDRAEKVMLSSDASNKEKAYVQGFMISAKKRCEEIKENYLEWVSSGLY